MASLDGELCTGQALVFLLPIAVNNRTLLIDEFAKIDADLGWGDAGITRIPRIVNELRRFNQVF